MPAANALPRILLAALVAAALHFSNAVIEPASAALPKCQGDLACDGIDPTTVGDGSCNGVKACALASGPIGDGSCNGRFACGGSRAPTGDGACNGDSACSGAGFGAPVQIGDGSCNALRACNDAGNRGKPANIGKWSCNGQSACEEALTSIADCEFNSDFTPPGCVIRVTNTAAPATIPETGGTTVTYTVRIDLVVNGANFLTTTTVNHIWDHRFPSLGYDISSFCQLHNADGTPVGTGGRPFSLYPGQYILCTYSYEPPPGKAGDTYFSAITLNAGDQSVLVGPHTDVIAAEASVLYVAAPAPQPTVTPLAAPHHLGAAPPGAPITPPATGDAGLAHGAGITDPRFIVGAVAVLTLTGIAIARRRQA